ncbi:MAG: LON peptidase substrate-binding domain-containing protein [Planctomycetota bacterium]
MSCNAANWPQWIPLFPLPNAVLLPKAILPLHIFEPRYRMMTTDALSGPRLIAMALLKPGYEPKYHTPNAEIHPTLCVGRILREEQLPDGRYNVLLQGLARCRLIEENKTLKYRRASLEPIPTADPPPDIEYAYRAELRRYLSEGPIGELAEKAGWLDLFTCSELSLSDLLDVLASMLLRCPDEKQAFLEETDVSRRAKRLCSVASCIASSLECDVSGKRPPRPWPPVYLSN